ncbi:MAG TPA: hypothetical protein DDW65_09305 [Firmicutes bacterium]|nr:hypothetical protein [Bacillota bacterium]
MIIDAHAHLGHDYVFDEDSNEQELLEYYRQFGIAGAIVQPFINRPYLEDTREIHDRIHAFCKKAGRYFWGMASINPHFRPADYEKEAERCVRKLGYVALKITPIAHAAHPANEDCRFVYEVAGKLKVPVMIHTGMGIPFADPASLLEVVGDFKDVKFVIAHAGSDMFFQQALYLARHFDNVYLEPSWINIMNIRKALETVGPTKLMFSSDQAINAPVELVKYRTLIQDPQQLERVLSGTAIEVFNLQV